MEILSLAPTQTPKSSAALSQLTGNLDSFLLLLTTQLRNQDPLNPLDTEKFTSQLVQFASVEQSIQTNRHLETLIGLQAAADRDGALSLIGKTIITDSDLAANAGSGALWTYSLPADAASASLTVLDSAGRPVAQAVGDPRAGSHAFKWNGALSDGSPAPAGTYRLLVRASDANGAEIAASVQSAAIVSGVSLNAAGPALETDRGAVALADVKRVIASN